MGILCIYMCVYVTVCMYVCILHRSIDPNQVFFFHNQGLPTQMGSTYSNGVYLLTWGLPTQMGSTYSNGVYLLKWGLPTKSGGTRAGPGRDPAGGQDNARGINTL